MHADAMTCVRGAVYARGGQRWIVVEASETRAIVAPIALRRAPHMRHDVAITALADMMSMAIAGDFVVRCALARCIEPARAVALGSVPDALLAQVAAATARAIQARGFEDLHRVTIE